MSLECECGKTVEDWRGARGHVQFTGDDRHGDKMSVPDGWRDLFDGDVEDDQGDEQDDQPDQPDQGDVEDEVEDEQPDEDEDTDAGRLRRALFDDVRALWGGDQ